MHLIYFGTRLSENISRREPEGYLICLNVPVARTGVQEYLPSELGLSGPDDHLIPVHRPESEVFAPACLASFEGMPVTDDHPSDPDGVNSENIRFLQRGHAHNIRRGAPPEDDLLLADLIITDPRLIEEILSGKREISCGYNYVLSEESGEYFQRDIRGNHVAVVENGRAGPRVSIKDHVGSPLPESPCGMIRTAANGKCDPDQRSGHFRTNERSTQMNRKTKAFAKMVSRMARDGEEEALEEVLAELIGEEPVPEIAVPAADPEPPVVVETPVDQPVLIDCGPEILAALNQIISLLTAAGADCGHACRQQDEDPEAVTEAPAVQETAAEAAEAAAVSVEATAEAVALAAAEALGIPVPVAVPDDDPVEELVAEILAEEALAADPAEGEEILSTIIDPEEVLDEDPANPEDPDDVSAADKADRVRAKLAAMRPRIAVARAKDRKAFNRQVNAYLKELRAQAAQDVNPYAAIRAKATHAPDDRDLGRRIMESRNANLKKN